MIGDKGVTKDEPGSNKICGKIVDEEDIKEGARDILYDFSCDGLRTLVMGRREVSEQEFHTWNDEWVRIKASDMNEDDKKK
ncbi:MAG: hypothetical protein V2I33_19790, partial [Kangiellaceae bacterium]|nr:hypothetical protein [Kangiellaceae bacterium]